jgi:hypothetical protein
MYGRGGVGCARTWRKAGGDLTVAYGRDGSGAGLIRVTKKDDRQPL